MHTRHNFVGGYLTLISIIWDLTSARVIILIVKIFILRSGHSGRTLTNILGVFDIDMDIPNKVEVEVQIHRSELTLSP